MGLWALARSHDRLRRVDGAAPSPDQLRLLLIHERMVLRFLRSRSTLQLSALYGHGLSCLSLLRRICEVSPLHRSNYSSPSGRRSDCTSVVSASSMDLHALHLLESLALHRAELRPTDDVHTPRRPHTFRRRAPRAASCFRCLLSDVAFQFSHRTFQ